MSTAAVTATTKDPVSMEVRIVDAAVELFTTHGIDGTSLQMIADALGVTKGAVYYHFNTKDEIVLAVYADSFHEVAAAVEQAETVEAVASRERALELLIPRVVALAVESRGVFSKLRFDPVMIRVMSEDEQHDALLRRLDRLFSGDDPGPGARIRTATVISALAGVPVHHLVRDLDDDALREHLTDLLEQIVLPTTR